MTDAFTEPLQQIEEGLQLVAAGVDGYAAAFMAAVSALRRDDRPDLPALRTLEGGAGLVRVAEHIVRRMRALGLELVLDRARTPGEASAAWLEPLAQMWPDRGEATP